MHTRNEYLVISRVFRDTSRQINTPINRRQTLPPAL